MTVNLKGTMFLTAEELEILTEYSKAALQCKELRRLGLPFEPSRTGRPIVLREVVIDRLGGSITKRKQPNQPAFERLGD